MITKHNYMIINFKINFNNYKEKVLDNYMFFDCVCPSCGSKHSFSRHGTYERNISTCVNNRILNEKVKILRLKCSSCNRTHAILPNDIIPFCIYSYSCIMHILSEHFINKKSVLSISKFYCISFQLIYFFISRLITFLKDCIYVLRTLCLLNDIFNPSIYEILFVLKDNSLVDYFPKIFFNTTKWIFLMKKFLNIYSCSIHIGCCNS